MKTTEYIIQYYTLISGGWSDGGYRECNSLGEAIELIKDYELPTRDVRIIKRTVEEEFVMYGDQAYES